MSMTYLPNPEFLQFSELQKRLHKMRYDEGYNIVDPYFSIIECLANEINDLNYRIVEFEKHIKKNEETSNKSSIKIDEIKMQDIFSSNIISQDEELLKHWYNNFHFNYAINMNASIKEFVKLILDNNSELLNTVLKDRNNDE
ncbi:MAG: hypothetical protein AB7V16_07220 [Vulcanibacillus sp.]